MFLYRGKNVNFPKCKFTSTAISMLFIHKEAKTVLVVCAAPSWWFMHQNMFCLISVMLAPQTDCVTFAVTKTDTVALRQVTAAGGSSLGICWVGDLGTSGGGEQRWHFTVVK